MNAGADPCAAVREAIDATSDRIAVALDALLPRPVGPQARLISAMRYAVLGADQPIRSFLTLEVGRLFGIEERSLLRAACAIECASGHARIHRDLPCLDDRSVRAERPATHVEFDAATAVLAGDALLAEAFAILAHEDTHDDPAIRCALIAQLARVTGSHGFAGGRLIEAFPCNVENPLAEVTRSGRMKTGGFIQYAAGAGPVMARAQGEEHTAVAAYSRDIGLTLQILDDLAGDVCEDARGIVAQTPTSEHARASFVTLLGLDGAREQARILGEQAKSRLQVFGARAEPLRRLVDAMLTP